jgi:hypothetical protein
MIDAGRPVLNPVNPYSVDMTLPKLLMVNTQYLSNMGIWWLWVLSGFG